MFDRTTSNWGDKLLTMIWQDQVTLPEAQTAKVFAKSFTNIIPVPVTILQVEGDLDSVLVLSEAVELMPALPLGDVLAEELDLDIPHDTFVILLPARETISSARMLSCDLGSAVGQALIHAVENSGPLTEFETESLFMMAHSAARLATVTALRECGVDSPGFALGLGDVLADHWRRERRIGFMQIMAQGRSDFLWQPELKLRLEASDPGAKLPEPVSIPGDLIRCGTKRIGLSEWLAFVGATVLRVMHEERGSHDGRRASTPWINLQ